MGMASLRPKAAAAAMDAATASSTPGTFPGRNRPATMMITVAAPNSSATGFTAPWSTASAVPAAVACNEPPETWIPRSRGNWLTMTASAMPLRYPTRIGFDSNPVTNPSRKSRPAMRNPPIRMASSPASATAWSGSRPASGSTAAAIMGASDESGPTMRTREGPKTA